MYKQAFRPITDALLKDSMYLVLTMPTTDESTMAAYVLFIQRSNWIINDFNNMEEIDVGSTLSMGKLGEDGHQYQVSSPGDNVYRLKEDIDKDRIYHFGQLWEPDNFKIWWENPNGELAQGWTRDTAVGVGDNEGYIWSDYTKYADKMPSDYFETFILPGVTPFIGFENSGQVKQKPTAKFLGKAYDVDIVSNTNEQEAMNIALGKGYNRTIKSFGPLDVFSVPDLPDKWGKPICLDNKQFTNNAGGR